jgi:hypothetical protein
MKKIYFQPGWALVFGLGLLFAIIDLTHKVSSKYIFELICGVLAFGFTFFYSIFPSWAYDQEKFEKRLFFFKKKTYKWADVENVVLSLGGDSVFFITKNQDRVMLGKLLTKSYTRNYRETLSEVVEYVRKNNPKAEIPPNVFKKAES